MNGSRRTFVLGSLLFAAACGAVVTGNAAEVKGPRTVISRAHADALIAKLPTYDLWQRAPDAATLAWGESHVLHAYVDMYEATDDPKYLVEVARRGEQLLTHRDDRRGVVDGSGKSRPGWTMAGKFTVGVAILNDAAGAPAIAVRSTPSSLNNFTKLEVIPADGPASKAGGFTLVVTNPQQKREERFADLSTDPSDARYFAKIVNDPRPTHRVSANPTAHSTLILLSASGAPGRDLAAQTTTLRPIPLAYMGYLGVIYHPLLRLAEHVRMNPRLASLKGAATNFVNAADESYTDASARLWREGPNKGEGYYVTCEAGESFPFDNVGQPFNFLGRHVCAELLLHRLTGKAEYRDRAERMTRLFKNRLRLDAEKNLYVWNYWYEPVTTTGWTQENSPSRNVPNYAKTATVEDISHGVLDIAMVVNAHQTGVLIGAADMKRFANTLLVHVLTPERDGVRRRVDGSAGVFPDYFPALAGWIDLAAADPAVYREIRKTVETAGPDNLQLVAALLKWERKLGEMK